MLLLEAQMAVVSKTFDLFNIEVALENDKLTATATGILGEVLQPYVDQFYGVLNSLKVIAHKDGMVVYNLYNPGQPSDPGMRLLYRRIKSMMHKMVFPAVGNFAVITGCQCRCVHCSADKFKTPDNMELSTDELKRTISDALDLGVGLVVFTGGEPMVRKDIFELVRHVDKKRAIPMMFTNGLLLTDENVKVLAEAGLWSLNISIDHPDPAVHDKLRRTPGCFKSVLEGAARARKAGILTGISTYASKDSVRTRGIENTIKLAQKEGFHEITIFDTVPTGKYLKHPELILTAEEKEELAGIARGYNESSHPMGVVAQCIINSPEGGGCFGAFSQFYVTAYGDVNPCDFNPVTFGNVRQMPIESIWQKMLAHPEYSKRKMHCRMQDADYRKKYIEPIPDYSTLPVPIENYM
jgi:MoaA/NifB/PqqE/SkfB family radical SAM enzyme